MAPGGWQAGRKERPAPRLPGEDPAQVPARILRDIQAVEARRPAPAALPAGAETAQDTYQRFLRLRLAPMLRELGLKGSGRHYRLDRGELRGWLAVQGGKWNNRAVVDFTLEVGVRQAPAGPGYWGDRIGLLLPDHDDIWWQMPAGADTAGLLGDLQGAVRDHALVAVEAAMDAHDHPPERYRARTFPAAAPAPAPLRLHGAGRPVQAPLGLEEAFAAASGADSFGRRHGRSTAYRLAPGDPRLPALLITALQSEPDPFDRAEAARLLGFVPSPPAEAVPALTACGERDENLEVRASALYASRLIRRRVTGGGR